MNATLLAGEHYLRALLDAFPSPVLIVDRNLEIQDANRAARELLQDEPDILLKRLCGDLIRCIHARHADGGCGTTKHCRNCVLRQTAEAVLEEAATFRRLSEMQIEKQDRVQKAWFLVSGSLFDYQEQKLVILTLEDITEVIELRRIIPICLHCRKVRDDRDFWQNVEDYLGKHVDLQFSHGICPACAQKHYSNLDLNGD